MHYLLIGIIIIGIVILQIASFLQNRKTIGQIKRIFPASENDFLFEKEEEVKNADLVIKSQSRNSILDVIISSINNYLVRNKGAVNDFHLMKDIVDRNCDSKEEEIYSQIPVPLYLGLAGTMLGILIGIGFLVFGGGLKDLLYSSNGSSAKGVETLLGGVALAMICSINGIILTTFSSLLAKNAKSTLEKNKHIFLSWIQVELLPNVSNDTSGALVKLTANLTTFNKTFSKNSTNLNNALGRVNQSYAQNNELIDKIEKLKLNEITATNIDFYEKISNSSSEIQEFATYLEKSNKYLSNIEKLNERLDSYEKRTQVIETAGKFYSRNEKWLADNLDTANLEVKEALTRFNESTSGSIDSMKDALNEQILNFHQLVLDQQKQVQEAFQEKLEETTKIVDELKNLTHIKEGIKSFKEATNRQNHIIEQLTKEIHELAKVKTSGGSIQQEVKFPVWLKTVSIAGGSLIVVACLSYFIPVLSGWVANLFS